MHNKPILKSSSFDTPLGQMIAISDEKALLLLEFADRKNLEREIERLKKKINSEIIPGNTEVLSLIQSELTKYFEGMPMEFKTPLSFLGSPFQNRVWEELKKIPPGKTRSYLELANAIGKPTAFRAVAQANSRNQLAIIIPCHRVINANGGLGGYSNGLDRKKWLINHESYTPSA